MTSKGGREARTFCLQATGNLRATSAKTPTIGDAPGKSSRGFWFQSAGLGNACRTASASTSPLTSITYLTLASVARVAWRRRRSCCCLPDRCLRPPSGWQIPSGSERPDSVAQGRRPRGRLSTAGATSKRHLPRKPPATAVGSIDSACASAMKFSPPFSRDDDTLRLLCRVDDDDSQRDFVGRRDL